MDNLKKVFLPMAGKLKPLMAFFLAFFMVVGIAPMNVLASAANVRDGQNISAPQVVQASPDFMYLDGERVSLDDGRIINVVQVAPPITPFAEGIEATASGNVPNVSSIFSISGEFSYDPVVYMGTTRVSALRYAVEIDGVLYEAFCADPALPGPENQAAVYALSGQAAALFKPILRYGFPTNPYMSEFGPVATTPDDMMWLVYLTRVAVAIAGNPTRQFTGDMDTIQRARDLVDGHPFWVRNFDVTRPAIMVNGSANAADLNNMADSSATTVQSEAFVLSYHRRNHNQQNRFRFEWAAGTPAGAQLVVDGNVIATAPNNSSEVFWGDMNFHIRMPNTPAFHNQEAKVYLVGHHNQFSNTVWLMQNTTNQQNWQDIVFYIPYMRASAAFSFESVQEDGGLRIVKQNPSGQGLAGAVFQIAGPDGFSVTKTTPSNGTIFLEGLEPGTYTVTEISPPPGHTLASPSTVTVTVPPGNTEIIEKVFVNEPYTNGITPEPMQLSTVVQITKINELTTELVPGASVRLRGISNQTIILPDGSSWQLDNTGIDVTVVLTAGHALPPLPPNPEDGPVMNPVTHELQDGVWTLFNLPFGAYIVYEVTPPHNFSILPAQNHGGAYAFWLAPPNLSVIQSDVEDGEDGEPQVMIDWDDFAQLLMELAGIDIGEEPFTISS